MGFNGYHGGRPGRQGRGGDAMHADNIDVLPGPALVSNVPDGPAPSPVRN